METVSSEPAAAEAIPAYGAGACTSASLARRAAVFCDPDVSIAEAAGLMNRKHVSAVLVSARGGLGIVTDADLRGKVVALRASSDAPVSTIMSQPVQLVDADATVQEARLIMLEAGVDHLPVVDAKGVVVGRLSAWSVMSMDPFRLFALRRTILKTHSVDELTEVATLMPRLYVDLVDAHLDAPTLSRIVSTLATR